MKAKMPKPKRIIKSAHKKGKISQMDIKAAIEAVCPPRYVQLLNPMSKRWIKVDRHKAKIIEKNSPEPWKNVSFVYSEKPLSQTNPHLKDPIERERLIKRSVETSSAVEGIKSSNTLAEALAAMQVNSFMGKLESLDMGERGYLYASHTNQINLPSRFQNIVCNILDGIKAAYDSIKNVVIRFFEGI